MGKYGGMGFQAHEIPVLPLQPHAACCAALSEVFQVLPLESAVMSEGGVNWDRLAGVSVALFFSQ